MDITDQANLRMVDGRNNEVTQVTVMRPFEVRLDPESDQLVVRLDPTTGELIVEWRDRNRVRTLRVERKDSAWIATRLIPRE